MLTVDLESSIPLEEQIRRGIRETIARGELGPGDSLPSVRQLAGDLGIHFNTVARAYRKLRDEGLLQVGRGKGVTVATDGPSGEGESTRGRIQAKLREILTEARLSGLPFPEVKKLLTKEIDRWAKEIQA